MTKPRPGFRGNSPVVIDRGQGEWADDGCELARACLSCPLPECAETLHGRAPGALKRLAPFAAALTAGQLTLDAAAAALSMPDQTLASVRPYAGWLRALGGPCAN